MLKIRLAELKIASIYPSDKIQSPIHLSIGQEAVSAGVCRALEVTDHIYGTYRGHGLFIGKGGDLKKMFAELYGKDAGCSRGKGGSMHLITPEMGLMGCSAIVGSTIPVATGAALASQMQGRNRVIVSFFGDGAVSEGVFFESLNFAALKGLPIVFVCENNGLAVHSKVSDHHKETRLYKMGEGLGVVGKRFDGCDVRIVYSSMLQAVRAVRNGGAPVFLEYMTYRWYEHVGPKMDLTAPYRDPQDSILAFKNDPLMKLKKILWEQFEIVDEMFLEWEKSISQEIEAAVAFAETGPLPDIGMLYEDIYEQE
jgi:TPP-dependent pyruvate/acetoin dehydrogenase alpha subunit